MSTKIDFCESTRQPRDSFTTTLDAAMRCYPDLYPTRNHFLFGVFLAAGTGWKWLNGVLVNDGYKESEKETLPEYLTEAAEEARLFLTEMGEPIEFPPSLPKRLLLDDSVPLANLPADVLPEWLCAAQEALVLALSDHFTPTPQDNEILFRAEARIRSLLEE